jgi:hypothetical protein
MQMVKHTTLSSLMWQRIHLDIPGQKSENAKGVYKTKSDMMLAFIASRVVKVSAFAATLREEIALSTTLKESSAWQGALHNVLTVLFWLLFAVASWKK